MKKLAVLAVLAWVILPLPAEAAWWQATVKEVNSDDRSLIIERVDSEERESLPKELQVKILDNAKLKNIANLAELQAGQEIKLDVRANKEQGYWDANYVELIDADTPEQAPAQIDQSRPDNY